MSAKQENVARMPAPQHGALALTLVLLLVVAPLLLAVVMSGDVPGSLTQDWGPIRHPWSVPVALAFWLLVAAGVAVGMNWLLGRITHQS